MLGKKPKGKITRQDTSGRGTKKICPNCNGTRKVGGKTCIACGGRGTRVT